MSLRSIGILLAIAAAALPGAARACTPMPPDWVPPPIGEQAKSTFDHATDIVYGIVTRTTRRGKVPFKVLHVYKGPLKAGARLRLEPDIRGCSGIRSNAWKGRAGVVVFNRNRPRANFLDKDILESLFEKGLIRRASPAAAGSFRSVSR